VEMRIEKKRIPKEDANALLASSPRNDSDQSRHPTKVAVRNKLFALV